LGSHPILLSNSLSSNTMPSSNSLSSYPISLPINSVSTQNNYS
ncbi:16146_t:CDS:1, partial [Racocetra persica]